MIYFNLYSLKYAQDKYLMDMDELFSQVDEKRKVSMKMNFLLLDQYVIVYDFMHSLNHFSSSLFPPNGGLDFIPTCIGQQAEKLLISHYYPFLTGALNDPCSFTQTCLC